MTRRKSIRSFLLGSAPDLQRDQLATYTKARSEQGNFAEFRLGPPRIGMIFNAAFHPDAAHQVLATDAQSYAKDAPIFREIVHFFGDGLLTSHDQRWRQHRRIVQPLFTRKAVAGHLDAMGEAAERLIAAIGRDGSGGRPVDLVEHSNLYALDVLGAVVFGADLVQTAAALHETLPLLSRHVANRGLAAVRVPYWIPSPANRRGERARTRLWTTVDEIIARRRQRADTDTRDLLGLLLAATDPETGLGLSDEDVRAEALVFLAAGHETTATVLTFALDLLARHPAMQDRVRAEVASLGEHRPLDAHHLDSLHWTSKVVDETMRLYPPGHTIVRRATTDVVLNGCPLPSGRIVAINIWGLHRNPEIWNDPERFDPDRFAVDRPNGDDSDGDSLTSQPGENAIDRYAYLPFGGGPRKCVGAHLATAEILIGLAETVRAYTLEPVGTPPGLDVGVVLRPRPPVFCLLTPTGPS
jgi:cytochrome P450